MSRMLFTFLLLLFLPACAFALSAVLETRVEAEGQRLLYMRLSDLPEGALPKAGDFTLNADSRNGKNHWHSKATEIRQEGEDALLFFEDFSHSWVDVGWWDVGCRKRAWAFNKDVVLRVLTDPADGFVRHSIYREDWSPTGEAFDYSLYLPEGEGPFPLVLVLHGMSDYEILLSGREACVYAEADFQARHPCIILVPYFDEATTISREEVLRASLEKIDELCAQGVADPVRLYLSGLSMGGYHGILLLTRYSPAPRFAAALLFCPWMDRTLTEEEVSRAIQTPIYLLHGERDPYIPDPGAFARVLRDRGSTCAHTVVYTRQDFERAGADSQHSVDLPALSDDRYVEWLFAQRLGQAERGIMNDD